VGEGAKRTIVACREVSNDLVTAQAATSSWIISIGWERVNSYFVALVTNSRPAFATSSRLGCCA
jgi:hypothetical protein